MSAPYLKAKVATKWVRYNDTPTVNILNHDVCIYGSGAHLNFQDFATKQHHYLRCDRSEVCDGIICYATHQTASYFAIAEKCLYPSVIIFEYPSLKRISTIKDESPDGYLSITFGKSEHLITLNMNKTFDITLWSWRTGQQIIRKASNFPYDKQTLKYCELFNMFVQFSVNKTRILKVWDAHICGTYSTMNDKNIVLPRGKANIIDALWIPEESLKDKAELLILDNDCNIYQWLPNLTEVELIIENRDDPDKIQALSFAWYNDGIALACTENHFKYYQKSNDEYSTKWRLAYSYTIELFDCNQLFIMNKNLMAALKYDRIVQIDIEKRTIHQINMYLTDVYTFELIWPKCEYLVTLIAPNNIAMWHIGTGERVAILCLIKPISYLTSHPKIPVAAAGCTDGTLVFVDARKQDNLSILMTIYLIQKPIDEICFQVINSDDFVLAGNKDAGNYFLLRGHIKTGWQVVSQFDLDCQIRSSFMLSRKSDQLKIYSLQVTSKKYEIGNIMLVLTFENPRQELNKRTLLKYDTKVIKLPYYYYSIQPNRALESDQKTFYACPFSSRTLHILEQDLDDDTLKLIDTKPSGHQMKLFSIRTDPYHVVTFGYDGLVFIYDSLMKECKASYIAHHRRTGGINFVAVGHTCKYVITLATNLLFLCTELLEVADENPSIPDDVFHVQTIRGSGCEIIAIKNSEDEQSELVIIDSNTPLENVREILENTNISTWMKLKEEENLLLEAIRCADERKSILQEVEVLRQRIKTLLDENEMKPPDEILPIQEFNIDHDWVELRKLETKAECEKLEKILVNKINEYNRAKKAITDKCWPKNGKSPKTLRALYGTTELSNFGIRSQELENVKSLMDITIASRNVELTLAGHDKFRPWLPWTEEDLKSWVAKPPSIIVDEEKDKLLSAIAEEELLADVSSDEAVTTYDEKCIQLYGTTAHRFIPTKKLSRYTQFELKTMAQLMSEKNIQKGVTYDLRNYFNKKFDEFAAHKQEELRIIKNSMERLREILGELNIKNTVIEDPYVPLTETPERIITVEENEVFVSPYISPERQAELDAEAAEEERQRLLWLSDNFRAEFLQRVMDGVLEVTWADKLKLEIPKPACLLNEVDPSQYTVGDIAEIESYKEKVTNQARERLHYKRQLENEYSKIRHFTIDRIKAFNEKLAGLYELKLKVDSAIKQEEFRINNQMNIICEQHDCWDKELKLRQQVDDKKLEIDNLIREFEFLQRNYNECQLNVEKLLEENTRLEKNYITNLKLKTTVDIMTYLKILRQRPHYEIHLNSTVLYHRMINYIIPVNQEDHEYYEQLPLRCLSYLKLLYEMDLMLKKKSELPRPHILAIIKIRRNKIQHEFKLKAAECELEEAEASINSFKQKLANEKELLSKFQNQLQNMRKKILRDQYDFTCQYVLKSGNVELPLTGSLNDFDTSILIDRSVVDNLNDLIKHEGDKKILIIRDIQRQRNALLEMEWVHKSLATKMRHLREDYEKVCSIKYCSHLQNCLRYLNEDPSQLDAEVEKLEKKYLTWINRQQDELNKIDEKIEKKKKENEILDEKIRKLHINNTEIRNELMNNEEFLAELKTNRNQRFKVLHKRLELINKIQEQYNEIKELKIERELLCLKNCPT